jgi:predicted GH43/DUF377 family glycosyl hydrolase
MNKSWMLGPFIRPENENPVITPKPDSVFDCPMREQPINWEKLHTFNPAAIVKDGKIHVIYRAEDDTGKMKVGGHTSRLGLASSEEGIHFERRSTPIFYPDDDDQKKAEWDGGCEDPRIVRTEEGEFILLYTQYNRVIPKLAVAISPDLIHWQKYGSVFSKWSRWRYLPTKSASIVCRIINGELRAAKIHGKYWMYFGERKLYLADSPDGIRWTPRKVVHRPRAGYYDSMLTEAGPPAVLIEKGVILLYNGKNHPQKGDPELAPDTYSVGQILFDKSDFGKVIAITEKPCFQPELPFEKTGQYTAGTTFAEGLVLFRNNWYLYYGCADSFVAVAIADAHQ